MLTSIVSYPIEQTFIRLKKILRDSNCKIISEKPSRHICVTQGSLRGILPISAKKVISFNLLNEESGTKIESSSRISSDWKNLTLYGSIIAAVLMVIFVWILIDINIYFETGKPVFWAWFAQMYGSYGSWGVMFIIRLIQALTIFLAFTIVFEIIIVIYVYPRKDVFSLQVIEKITKNEQQSSSMN